jgi:hypothetical protein
MGNDISPETIIAQQLILNANKGSGGGWVWDMGHSPSAATLILPYETSGDIKAADALEKIFRTHMEQNGGAKAFASETDPNHGGPANTIEGMKVEKFGKDKSFRIKVSGKLFDQVLNKLQGQALTPGASSTS